MLTDMEFLSPDAACTFLLACQISYEHHLIGRYEFLSRMASLESICRPDSETAEYARHVLKHKGWEKECSWTDPCENTDEGVGARRDAPSHGENAEPGFSSEQEGWTKSFMTDKKMNLSTIWDFHKGDADPDPSVPHGHAKQDSRTKLHAYRGYIYFQGKQVNRESRAAIVRLWNDAKFRAFAMAAIRHFVEERPDWAWDRDPLLLPRARATDK